MKLKSKLRFPKSLVIIASLAIISINCLVFQGCQEEYIIPNNDLPYLELSSSIENMSSADYEILNQAKERLAEYISSDKGKFDLKIKSGNQVNISDELFEYFQFSINNANNKLKDSNYRIEGDRVLRKRNTGILRLKSGVVEGDNGQSYVLYSGIDYTWYGMDINVSHEDLAEFQAGTFGVSYLLAKYETGVPQVDAWINCAESVSFFTGLLSSVWDDGNGFTIVCPLYVPTYTITY
jgi:hypothetical protein